MLNLSKKWFATSVLNEKESIKETSHYKSNYESHYESHYKREHFEKFGMFTRVFLVMENQDNPKTV